MTLNDVKKYLRQNKPTQSGKPGSYYLRVLYFSDFCHKPKRKEIGLGTNIEWVACIAARTFLHGCYALGARFSTKIRLVTRKGKLASLPQAPIENLPLWKALPPHSKVEKQQNDQ